MAEGFYNFVKFLRGNSADFKALPSKDADTLYFIYEEDQDVGQLWIGDRLITEHTDKEKVIDKLEELLDVDTTGVSDKQILAWNTDSQKWTPISISSSGLIEILIGATENSDGKPGLVPAPKRGDQNKYLRGDGSWTTISDSVGLKTKKINSLSDIDVNNEKAEDFIYLLWENNSYSEFLVIDKTIEPIGTLQKELENYVTTELEQVNIQVEQVKLDLSNVNKKVVNIAEQLNQKISVETYNKKMAEIEADISSLKASTTWGGLK